MKCVDCLHYDMCPDKDIKNPAYPTETFADLNNIEKTCVHFKDADRYMELACKVGEYAYRVVSSDYESMRVGKYKIVPILMHDQYEIVKMMKEAEDWRKGSKPQIGWVFFREKDAITKCKEINDRDKHLIWTNKDINYDEAEMRDEYPDATPEELYQHAIEENLEMLEDEKENLNIEVPEGKIIVCFATLGLWDGPTKGVMKVGPNIKDCLTANGCDIVEWYVHAYDFYCDASHHDGVNSYQYRIMNEDEWEDLKAEFSEDDFERLMKEYTHSMGKMISDVYGW